MLRLLIILVCAVGLAGCGNRLKDKDILIIGDSNGEREGWAYQFQELRGGGGLVNTSLSGNTLGFNYGPNTSMNTLENLTSYLRRGYAEMGSIDEIIVMLGTNDCKGRFRDRQDAMAANMVELLTRTNKFFNDRGQPAPRIVLATPPSFGPNEKVVEEFRDGQGCIAAYSDQLRAIAAERNLCLVDLQRSPGDAVQAYSEDGIHFAREGYVLLARAIIEQCY